VPIISITCTYVTGITYVSRTYNRNESIFHSLLLASYTSKFSAIFINKIFQRNVSHQTLSFMFIRTFALR